MKPSKHLKTLVYNITYYLRKAVQTKYDSFRDENDNLVLTEKGSREQKKNIKQFDESQDKLYTYVGRLQNNNRRLKQRIAILKDLNNDLHNLKE